MDVMNKFLVGTSVPGRIVIQCPPHTLTPDDALLLAAWLVALAEPQAAVKFHDVRKAVEEA